MPPPQIKEESRVFGESMKKLNKASDRKSKVLKLAEEDLLFDIMGDGSPPTTASNANRSSNNTDLLANILGGSTSPATSPTPQQSNMSSIMDLFCNSNSSAPSQPPLSTLTASSDLFSSMSSLPPQHATPTVPTHACYGKNDLNITLQL